MSEQSYLESLLVAIDWNAFTPLPALAGGGLIGLSAVLLVLLTGRVAGISGIVGGLLKPQTGEVLWRVAFVLGLLLAPWLSMALLGPMHIESPREPWLLIIAGLLVGYGTRLGSGCTSGHGVCGLSRLSRRSLVAVLVFMAAGFAAASLLANWL
ncbi:MAG TPA: YeeE/YedE family protein [Limnobacter sp.]|nr:YeeE/YedE family protein [Limnobacter sp.]